MGNYLNRRTEVFALALLIQNVPINLTCRKIGKFVKVFVYKAFVMSEVKVCLRAVLRNVYFAVLLGAHRSRVNVYVRVEFLCRDFKSARFQKSSERCCRYAFAETGNNSARDKNVLCLFHIYTPLRFRSA